MKEPMREKQNGGDFPAVRNLDALSQS